MNRKEIENYLNTAISEINYALKSNKSKDVKEFYLENAIRFINSVIEKLDTTDEFQEGTKQIIEDIKWGESVVAHSDKLKRITDRNDEQYEDVIR